MRTEEEIIEDYRETYFEEFGEEITFDEAQEHLMRLVKFLRVALKTDDIRLENIDHKKNGVLD